MKKGSSTGALAVWLNNEGDGILLTSGQITFDSQSGIAALGDAVGIVYSALGTISKVNVSVVDESNFIGLESGKSLNTACGVPMRCPRF